MSENLNLISVSLKEKNINHRLEELINFINKAPENSLILASELCISGYDFDGAFDDTKLGQNELINSFDQPMIKNIQNALKTDKFLGFTHLVPSDDLTKIYNKFMLLSGQNVVYTQNKAKLFLPNLEDKKFHFGDEEKITPFDFMGLKIGVLICFELRFTQFWARLNGCDMVLVPAMWGKERAQTYELLCKALAVANNCYVMASSALDLEFAGVFLPDGHFQNEAIFDKSLILKIKHNLGIK